MKTVININNSLQLNRADENFQNNLKSFIAVRERKNGVWTVAIAGHDHMLGRYFPVSLVRVWGSSNTEEQMTQMGKDIINNWETFHRGYNDINLDNIGLIGDEERKLVRAHAHRASARHCWEVNYSYYVYTMDGAYEWKSCTETYYWNGTNERMLINDMEKRLKRWYSDDSRWLIFVVSEEFGHEGFKGDDGVYEWDYETACLKCKKFTAMQGCQETDDQTMYKYVVVRKGMRP